MPLLLSRASVGRAKLWKAATMARSCGEGANGIAKVAQPLTSILSP